MAISYVLRVEPLLITTVVWNNARLRRLAGLGPWPRGESIKSLVAIINRRTLRPYFETVIGSFLNSIDIYST